MRIGEAAAAAGATPRALRLYEARGLAALDAEIAPLTHLRQSLAVAASSVGDPGSRTISRDSGPAPGEQER
ncbi:hypothetical protein AB0L66_22600 [Streptomyces sp. NPDC052207]|uniref:hypothetical protein n=1 Tax=Streptomyces sp. NPDC052207 TaxID=3155418 RepID=UPI003419C808